MNASRDVTERHDLWLKVSAWLALLSDTTQRTYVGIVKEYCAFLGAPAGSSAAAELLIRSNHTYALSYVHHLKRTKGQSPRVYRLHRKFGSAGGSSLHSPATIAKKIMALRKMYEVLMAHRLFTEPNPFSPHLVPVPNSKGGRKRDTEMLDFARVPEILASVEDGPRAARDRALLSLLFGGGLRRGEVAKIILDDIGESHGGTHFVRLRCTKDGQDHLQALPDWAAAAVLLLKKERQKRGAGPQDFLFTTWTGRGGLIPTDKPMPDIAVYHVFKAACARVGLGPQYTPHSARATAITKLLADGVPHREVQEFSRHKSVQMVEWYDKRRFGVDRSPAKSLTF